MALAAICLLLALQACGFRPLYAERADAPATTQELAAIEIGRIRDRTGQLLRNELLDRMNPKNLAVRREYNLSVELSESRQNLAVRRDDTATLANLVLTAAYSLTRQDGEEVLAGIVRSFNSYDISRSDFATIAAETDARARAARDLADDITIRVAVFLADLEEPR